MVKGFGICGFMPGTHFQSSNSAFHRCTWASTITRLDGAAIPFCEASATPAASAEVPNCRRDIMPITLPKRTTEPSLDQTVFVPGDGCQAVRTERKNNRGQLSGYPPGLLRGDLGQMCESVIEGYLIVRLILQLTSEIGGVGAHVEVSMS